MSPSAVPLIDESLARKVLDVVDAGLVSGLGQPAPGKMCVEAAVNYAMGAPHGDQPACVAESLRRMKIKLNVSKWSSDAARTKGLRRLAIAQLGSAGVLDEREFSKRVATLAIQVCVPEALRAAAKIQKDGKRQFELLRLASLCESDPTRANAVSARDGARDAAAAAAAAADARDKSLAGFCEAVVQVLIDMKAPGCQWLWLTEAA